MRFGTRAHESCRDTNNPDYLAASSGWEGKHPIRNAKDVFDIKACQSFRIIKTRLASWFYHAYTNS